MKTLSLLLLIAGLLAGPAYWIYAKFYTGSQVALLDLNRSGSDSWRSPGFDLSADMAAVGLLLNAQATAAPAVEGQVRQARCLATLHRDAEVAQPLSFTLSTKVAGDTHLVFREHLLYMQAVRAGHYWLEVTPSTPADLTLTTLRLEVRRNLADPDNRVVTAGLVLFVLGLIGLVAI